MAKTHLAVFVHGWGADAGSWWGSTQGALKQDERLAHCGFYFHSYATSQMPAIGAVRRAMQLLNVSQRAPVLGVLGQGLWSQMRQMGNEHRVDRIVLFGHSFGGLVIADALLYGRTRARSNPKDQELLDAIEGIALCASPLAGAGLAKAYQRAAAVVGFSNPHVENLLKSSKERMEAVDGLIFHLRGSARPDLLALFGAENDEIVEHPERWGPLHAAGVQPPDELLAGNHSGCVINIGPVEKRDNFEKIVRWLMDATGKAASAAPLEGKSGERSFSTLVQRLNAELDVEPIRSWGTLRHSSEVDDLYVLRIYLQKLVYVASIMSAEAMGSANLWVGCMDKKGRLHLKSEEREGNFSIAQLISYTGDDVVDLEVVGIRPNRVHTDINSWEKNSAGARAYLSGKPQLVSIDGMRNGFDSSYDRQLGVTHVLGVPLYSVDFVSEKLGGRAEGRPLALTADFHFPREPDNRLREQLLKAAEDLQACFWKLHGRWAEESIELYKKPVPPLQAHA